METKILVINKVSFKTGLLVKALTKKSTFCVFRGSIFSYVRPSYEQAVSNLDSPMNISLKV
jgi:hypothetical protein